MLLMEVRMLRSKKVFVVNQSAHDFSGAKKFGKLVYLSRKPMSKFATNNCVRLFLPEIRKSHKDDYVLITGLSVMSAIACVLFAIKHGGLNLLIYHAKTHAYVERKLSFENVMDELKGDEDGGW